MHTHVNAHARTHTRCRTGIAVVDVSPDAFLSTWLDLRSKPKWDELNVDGAIEEAFSDDCNMCREAR